ncbi:4-aminobutyrate--2-oxoglutarate transaminase [Porticoccus sp. W117]|uniref:4-aminobutyrate--2-oxoglutarate transaminase n=1 Tax=Porticoccus sp. W117 TaxID=3054777 RepID=UPI0025966D87|nr:4-aminobutyrate--2-oxoglutarate transaminase [Porticoccus sp. W117]MDM3870555.1 4-aminobutyrate--2-oxoglutarate transaminase [Porticoccus sp. W117]
MNMQAQGLPEKAGDKMTTNAELQARKEQAIARGQGNLAPFYIDRADNAELWDVEGNRYIDFGSGIAVVNTGHNHPKVKAAVQAQLEKFSHTCVMVTPYDSAVELAEQLNQLAPGDTPKKTIFVTTGAEAVENCIKIARAHTGRRGVIAFNGGFHGRTMMAMGLTGKVTPYKNLFGPFPGEIFHAPYPIPYHGISEEESLKALNNLFKVDIEPSDVAAIILEPVQGEGGFYPASDSFMQALRKLCDEHGIMLIADEIQTGFARTGKFFCTEYSGVEPDLMTAAKGIAGGFPIAAVIGKAEVMDSPNPGGLGGTYGGSPIGCAAALAVLDVIKEEGLVERANHIGALFGQRLGALQAQYPNLIGEIRSERGAMIAMELIQNGDSEQPNPELTKALVAKGQEKGLILLSCGFRSNVIRFLPALTIGDDVANEGLDILEQCFAELN